MRRAVSGEVVPAAPSEREHRGVVRSGRSIAEDGVSKGVLLGDLILHEKKKLGAPAHPAAARR